MIVEDVRCKYIINIWDIISNRTIALIKKHLYKLLEKESCLESSFVSEFILGWTHIWMFRKRIYFGCQIDPC